MALGTNGPITDTDFDNMMSILQGASRIVFVNVHVDRPWQDPNNQVLASGAARYHHVFIADWATLANQNPQWFGSDGTHLAIDGPGADALAQLITDHIVERLSSPTRVARMDARQFLGMEPVGDDLHWRMEVKPQLTTPGNFLFGGCGLGAALVALEAASGRPTVWATGQYLSYAPTHSVLEWEVNLAVVGGHVTQGRAVGRVNDREILTVNAALGRDELDVSGIWVEPPKVPSPEECPPRYLPADLPQHHHGQGRSPHGQGSDVR